VEVRAQGVVRVMHPDKGMGVEFKLSTAEHRAAVEKFLSVLTENRDLQPELLVQPEGLETDSGRGDLAPGNVEDPLLQLFYGQPLSADEFLDGLRQQRATPTVAAESMPGAQALATLLSSSSCFQENSLSSRFRPHFAPQPCTLTVIADTYDRPGSSHHSPIPPTIFASKLHIEALENVLARRVPALLRLHTAPTSQANVQPELRSVNVDAVVGVLWRR
jgi:hypothetical protein